jgi:hypothetical protein
MWESQYDYKQDYRVLDFVDFLDFLAREEEALTIQIEVKV